MARRIGRYEIQAELGRGGFGQVFRAFDPTVGRPVAIKTLNAGGETGLLTRFRNEAAAAGQLRHPNIVTIFDFGDHEGTPYMVMELLEGEDLQHVISNARPLSLVRKLEIMRQIADGLHHAHVKGIVHRDVKPANAMLLPDGTVKILDFGIALLTQEARSRLTPQGNIIGTFRYMAPEQFHGSATDLLSDIFAYGLIFYELLTGSHAFAGAEAAAVMYNIMHTEPRPLRAVNADYPEALEQLVSRTLAKDRESRYQSLEDVMFDLGPVLQDLRKDRARSLVDEAQKLVAAEQTDAAQSVLREILELDSGNRTARQLREAIQQQAQRRALQPRIEALIKTGHGHLANRQFQNAVETLESALKLDKSNSQIHVMLEQARAMLDQSRRVDTLLTQARHAMQQRNLTGAYASAAEALQADPASTAAAALAGQIRTEMDARERERVLREALAHGADLLRTHAFDEAIAHLTRLGAAHPESQEAKDLLARAQQEKHARARQLQLESDLNEAKSLMRAQRFEDAVSRLDTLRRGFPETAEVRDLLALAEREAKAQKQAEQAARVEQEVARLLDLKNFGKAISLLEEAARRIPGHRGIETLLQTARAAQEAHHRRSALEAALKAAGSLKATHKFTDAIAKLDAFSSEYGADAAIADLRTAIAADESHFRKQEALKRLIHDIRDLTQQRKPGNAIQIARRALAEFPENPELLSLLTLAQAQQKEQQRLEAVNRILSQTTTLAATQGYDQALDSIREGLRSYPDDAELLRQQAKTLEEKAARAREREEEQRKLAAEEAERKRQAIEAEAQRRAAERAAAEKKAREEAARREAADKLAREEAARKAADAAALKARQDAERQRQAVEAQRQREAAESKARQEAERQRQAEEAQRQREAAESRARQEAERQRQEAEAQRQREAAESRARQEAERQRQEAEAQRQREAAELRSRQEAEAARRAAESKAAREPARPVSPAQPPDAKPIPKVAIGAGIAAVLAIGGYFLTRPTGPAMQPVEIRSSVPNVAVQIGGQSCVTPACRLELAPGSYTLEAAAEGYTKLTRKLTVGDQPLGLDLTLEQLAINPQPGKIDTPEPPPVPAPQPGQPPPAPVAEATLVLRGAPAGASVSAGNRNLGVVGSNGSLTAKLPPGDLTLQFNKDGFQPLRISRSFPTGQTVTISNGLQMTPLVVTPPAPQVTAASEWENVRRSQEPSAYEDFRRKYPNTPQAAQAEERLHDLLWERLNKRDMAAMREYMNRFPRTRHAREIADAAAVSEWQAIDRNDLAKLREFQSRYAGTEFGSRAAQEITRLERERQAAIEKAKQPEPPVKQPVAPPTASEAPAIRAVLARFAAAFSNKDINAMRAVWPTMPRPVLRRYTDAFKERGTLSMNIKTVQEPAISGDSATAICEIVSQSSVQGQSVPGGSLVRISLLKQGGVWVIDNFRQ